MKLNACDNSVNSVDGHRLPISFDNSVNCVNVHRLLISFENSMNLVDGHRLLVSFLYCKGAVKAEVKVEFDQRPATVSDVFLKNGTSGPKSKTNRPN